jgi:hypothetical protein
MRLAADEDEGIEKLPVTPGAILPAREQLGYLLLAQSKPCLAKKEFETSLNHVPRRRRTLLGADRAEELCDQKSQGPNPLH